MIDVYFLSLLQDPLHKGQLRYNREKDHLQSESGIVYPVKASIPLLLPSSENAEAGKSAVHSAVKSDFRYLDHYKQDAITFDYFAGHETGVTRNEIKRLEETIASKVPQHAQIILDAGCGNGWVAAKFSEKKKVISMDIALTNVHKAKEKYNHKNHFGLVADVFHLPVKEGSMDCIIAAEIMEHVADPKLFLQKLMQALKPGGKLIVTTPYNEKIEYYLCVHCNKPTPKNAHLHSFNLENIKSLLPQEATISTFHNRYLLKLRSYLITQFFPFAVWKFIDRLANFFTNAPTRMMIEIVKT